MNCSFIVVLDECADMTDIIKIIKSAVVSRDVKVIHLEMIHSTSQYDHIKAPERFLHSNTAVIPRRDKKIKPQYE